jgi:hypothetical protein
MRVRTLIWCCVALAALAAAACDDDNPVDALQGVQFSYVLDDCDPASRALSKLADLPEDAITVTGNAVRFGHTLDTYCNAVSDSALAVSLAVQDTDIVITEWYEGAAVRCTCTFPISGQIDGLTAGNYRIWIIHAVRLSGVPDDAQPDPQVLYQGTITIPNG